MLSLPQKGSSLGSEQGGWDTQHHIFPDLKAPGLYMLFPSISGVGTMLMALHPPPPPASIMRQPYSALITGFY